MSEPDDTSRPRVTVIGCGAWDRNPRPVRSPRLPRPPRRSRGGLVRSFHQEPRPPLGLGALALVCDADQGLPAHPGPHGAAGAGGARGARAAAASVAPGARAKSFRVTGAVAEALASEAPAVVIATPAETHFDLVRWPASTT